ncbi:MAG: AzlD domain-containing protein [Clostridia bacterium]|nr:AzlD domain-containing protein [Clostridia bacterium]
MTERTAIFAVVISAAVTILLRFLPFLIFGNGRQTPKLVLYLGRVLPYAIMGMLVVYCLKDLRFSSVSGFLPQLIAGAVCVGSYVWKRNTLLSIVSSTVCYMLLVQLVF